MSGVIERTGKIIGRNVRDFRLFFDDHLVSRSMSPGDIDTARRAYAFIVRQGHLDVRDEVQLNAAINEAIDILDVKAISRRTLFNRVAVLGGVVLGLSGLISCTNEVFFDGARRRDFEYRAGLEARNTLGLDKSADTFSGYNIRYASRAENVALIPTGLVSDPLEPDIFIRLPGAKLNALDNTGIRIENHIRTTDNVSVGRLAISTKYVPPTSSSSSGESYTFTERWVLRDEPTDLIDSSILVLENSLASTKKYIGISRARSTERTTPTFQLRAYQPK